MQNKTKINSYGENVATESNKTLNKNIKTTVAAAGIETTAVKIVEKRLS